MIVLTRKQFIEDFPEVYKRQYWSEENGWRNVPNSEINAEWVYEQLLISKPQNGDFAFAITGDHWVKRYFEFKCELCREESLALVIVENVCDYKDIEICPSCLEEMLKSIRKAMFEQ